MASSARRRRWWGPKHVPEVHAQLREHQMNDTTYPTATSGLKVLQVTDCHLFASPEGQLRDMRTLDTLDAVLAQASEEAVPDAILATGDIAQEAHPATYATFLAAVREHFDAPLLCVPGNHDSEPMLSSALPVEPLTLATGESERPVSATAGETPCVPEGPSEEPGVTGAPRGWRLRGSSVRSRCRPSGCHAPG